MRATGFGNVKNNGAFAAARIDTSLDFPFALDMAPHISSHVADSGPVMYDLAAISNHHGDKSHYTALCTNRGGHAWHQFDDAEVNALPAAATAGERVHSTEAYVLFYLRRDGDPPLAAAGAGAMPGAGQGGGLPDAPADATTGAGGAGGAPADLPPTHRLVQGQINKAAWALGDSDANMNEEIQFAFSVRLRRHHLQCLKPGEWLKQEPVTDSLQSP